jgi:hypothetical protein
MHSCWSWIHKYNVYPTRQKDSFVCYYHSGSPSIFQAGLLLYQRIIREEKSPVTYIAKKNTRLYIQYPAHYPPITMSSATNTAEVIDWDEAMQQCGEDEEFLRELLADLRAETDTQMAKIEETIRVRWMRSCPCRVIPHRSQIYYSVRSVLSHSPMFLVIIFRRTPRNLRLCKLCVRLMSSRVLLPTSCVDSYDKRP